MNPVLYKYESDGQSSLDLNLKVRKMTGENYIWIGINLRMLPDQSFKLNSITPLIGFRQNKFHAAYSFNISLNQLLNYNSGPHMLTIGFDFKNRTSSCSCVN